MERYDEREAHRKEVIYPLINFIGRNTVKTYRKSRSSKINQRK